MHILLINTNPVVSRLLALCTRNEEMILEEVTNINALKRQVYDIVFVDEENYEKENLTLDAYVSTTKKILFSNEAIESTSFDMVVKKPFLPSQIIEILENVQRNAVDVKGHISKEEKIEEKLEDEKQLFIFPLTTEVVDVDEEKEEAKEDETQVLDVNEIEKIKALLDMDEKIEPIELSDDEIEAKKIEVIKEQLIADGLEIVEEDEIVESLSTEETIQIFDIAEALSPSPIKKEKSKKKKSTKTIKSKKSKKKKTDKKRNFDFTEEEREQIEDAIAVAIGSLKRKKMKKLLKGEKVDISIKLEEQN